MSVQKGFAPLFILIGAVALVIVAASAYFFMNPTTQPAIPVPKVPEISKGEMTLMLASPADGSLISGNQLAVKGKTSHKASVVFYTDGESGSVDTDASGNFEGSLMMEDGINTVTVTAVDEDGVEASKTVDVVYDSEK